MSVRTRIGWLVAAFGALALLAACTTSKSDSRVSPTATVQSATQPSPTPLDSDAPGATSQPTDAVRALVPESSTTRDRAQRGVALPQAAPELTPDRAAPTALRLPIAEDLGPNYFELFSSTSTSNPGDRRADRTRATLVAFGFSERAKLQDERIQRDGPLAAVARVTVHPTTESASSYAAAATAAGGLELSATAGTAKLRRLTAALTSSPPSSRELAPNLTASHSRQTGWFAALDGSRVQTVVEQWTVVRTRTVLTLALVWDRQVNSDWGQTLVQRLVQTEPDRAAPHAS